MSMILDRPAFIRRNTRLLPVPWVPEISIHMADDATELWQKTEADLDVTGLPPPFWAFAWAGGQALARYILDHPETVRGARVLDFASGSGLVAIAAACSGAATVTASDIDPFALDAIALNATANGVDIGVSGENLVGRTDPWEVILAADIFYERDTAGAVTAWLARRTAGGTRVLVGDPGRSYFDRTKFDRLASYDIPVMRSLEDADCRRSGVWRLKAEAGISKSENHDARFSGAQPRPLGVPTA
jgi:predicted nicotinamide N-methyase